jgi:predicted dehydrogenase
VTEPAHSAPSRRDIIKTTAGVATATALAGVAVPSVHLDGDDTIRLALVGCGGRGTGAAENALAAKNGPTKLVAMADVFQDRLNGSHKTLTGSQYAKQVDVPEKNRFVSFDGYKHAMDLLRPGDVVILTTPPAFRWVHFAYAIEKGLNVFMEKPVTVDGPSTRKLLKLNELAQKKDLKVGVGLMCRHCEARGELYKRIKDGQMGELTLLRAYRLMGPEATSQSGAKPEGVSDLLYQIKRFHSFLWASGGCYSDFLIHNIDECCWMKDAWPVQASGLGGRHYHTTPRGEPAVDQNFDNYSVEYTFADGTKLLLEGRTMSGCAQAFASYAAGTKGSAIISANSHTPARCKIFKGYNFKDDEVVWRYGQRENNPYQLEWDHLLAAIRGGKKYNECERGAKASLVTSMGRMASHTGQVITFDQMLNCEHEFAPDLDKLTFESAAPLQAGPGGKYPVPEPGIKKTREY